MEAALRHGLCRSDRSPNMLQKWLMYEDNLAKLMQHLLSVDLTQWDQVMLTNLLMFLSEEVALFVHQPVDVMLVQLIESIITKEISHNILICQLAYVLLKDWIEENIHNPVDDTKFIRLKRACDTKVKLQYFISNKLTSSSSNSVLILQNAMGINIDTRKRSSNDLTNSNEAKIKRLSYEYYEDPKVEEENMNAVFASLHRTCLWIKPKNKKPEQFPPLTTVNKNPGTDDVQLKLDFDKYHEIKIQILKLNKQIKSSVPSNSLTKQLKALASTIVSELGHLGASNIALNDQVYALYCMSCWRAHDDMLLVICESLFISDHVRGISISLMIAGILIPHVRLLTSLATRTLVRAIEIILNNRPELCVYGLLARCILVTDRNLTARTKKNTSSTEVSALASVPLPLLSNVKKCTAATGSIQFELLQRCTRQLLKPDQVGILIETVMTPVDALVETDVSSMSSGIRELVNTIHSIDSRLFLHTANTTSDTIPYAEFVSVNETCCNCIFHIPWDNDSLNAIQSILKDTRPKLKTPVISALITNLCNAIATTGTNHIVDAVSLPSLMHTLVTVYGSHFNYDSIRNDMRSILVKCTKSKILVTNCLNLLDTIEKSKTKTNNI